MENISHNVVLPPEEEKSNQKQASTKEESKTSDMVSSLDEFLNDDELNR